MDSLHRALEIWHSLIRTRPESVVLSLGSLNICYREGTFFRFQFVCGMKCPLAVSTQIVDLILQMSHHVPADTQLLSLPGGLTVESAFFLAMIPLEWKLSFSSIDILSPPRQSGRLLNYLRTKNAQVESMCRTQILLPHSEAFLVLRESISDGRCMPLAVGDDKVMFVIEDRDILIAQTASFTLTSPHVSIQSDNLKVLGDAV